MHLLSLEGNRQRLDGGSMFGNCPRAVWERWAVPDERHRIDLACRTLLITETSGRRVLLETGIGNYMAPDMRDRFGVIEAEHRLLLALASEGLQPNDIDVIVLSHLHFDHAGGCLLPFSADRAHQLAFPRARYVVGRRAWERARNPHPRDRASFIPELSDLLEATGRLELVGPSEITPIDTEHTSETLGDDYAMYMSEGHTPGLMLTRVHSPMGPLTFLADLIPGTPWVHLPITMGYDRYPELLIDEKATLLERFASRDEWVLYTHDPKTAVSRIGRDERGRYTAVQPAPLLRYGIETDEGTAATTVAEK